MSRAAFASIFTAGGLTFAAGWIITATTSEPMADSGRIFAGLMIAGLGGLTMAALGAWRESQGDR